MRAGRAASDHLARQIERGGGECRKPKKASPVQEQCVQKQAGWDELDLSEGRGEGVARGGSKQEVCPRASEVVVTACTTVETVEIDCWESGDNLGTIWGQSADNLVRI